MKALNQLTTWNRPRLLLISLVLIVTIGLVDYATGYEIAFSLFYVFPIFSITWRTTRQYGVVSALLSAGMWLMADIASGQTYSHPVIFLWNTGIRFGFFVIIVWLLAELRHSLGYEQHLARTDPLTGAINSRHFKELLDYEISRSRRYHHPLALVYLDVDNFKQLNDHLGHSSGDEALCLIVQYAQQHLRKTDVVARLGGDEFAILLPETDQIAARLVVSKFHAGLLQAVQAHQWPITFSIGVITCYESAYVIDQVIAAADRLMYLVKHSGKNAVAYQTCQEAAVWAALPKPPTPPTASAPHEMENA